MQINKTQLRQIDEALQSFLKGLRLYIIEKLKKEYDEEWSLIYYQSLNPLQQKTWDDHLQQGHGPGELIDWGHLKHFAIENRDYFKDDFGPQTGFLPTWLAEITEVRNKWAHNLAIEQEDAFRALGNMIRILHTIKMDELSEKVKAIRLDFYPEKIQVLGHETKVSESPGISSQSPKTGILLPWFMNVRPHRDIEQGNLDESVFAASLGEVARGDGREVYLNPEKFFQKTFFTAGMKNVARQVIKGLNGNEASENRVISLQTGFGGGKTHSLISLFHLVKMGKSAVSSELTCDLIKETGAPVYEKVNIAVFTNESNDPTQGRYEGDTHIKTLWGDLAWQLGGSKAFEMIRPNDENQTAPLGLFKKVLEGVSPALILIDELAHYCVTASAIKVGASTLADQTISFIQELTESITATNGCVAVVTLPASPLEVASSQEGHQILISLSNRLSRVGKDTKPVEGDEIFEVIRRRLFEDIGDQKEIDRVARSYYDFYKELGVNHEIPANASLPEYRERIRKSYPFHPELIDIFEKRWASHSDFQRTRGVLRQLGSIVADLWKRQSTLTGSHGLIHTSDINLGNLDAVTSQIKKLWGNGYDAVISADVSGNSSNAFNIDYSKAEFRHFSVAQGVSTTILMGTFGSEGAKKGLTIQDLKLMVLKPGTCNHNFINGAMDALEAQAHYLYYSDVGQTKRYWFHTRPNINILINQAKNDVKNEAVFNEIITRIENRKKNFSLFNVLVNPSDDLPEQTRLTLVIAHPEMMVSGDTLNGKLKPYIEKLATRKGNSQRIYMNTILFLVPTELGMNQLMLDLRELIACNKIKNDYQGQLSMEQKNDLRDKITDFDKKAERSICIAYSVIIKAGALSTLEKYQVRQFRETIDAQFNTNIIQALKDEEWLLDGIGYQLLQKNNLLPTVETPVKVKELYEAFLRFNDKPMITGYMAVQKSLLKYCQEGYFAIASGEPGQFSRIYLNENVPFFEVTSPDYYLVDKSLYKQEISGEIPQKTSEPYIPGHLVTIPQDVSQEPEPVKTYKSITISGKVDIANYSQVFTSFINPLLKNNVEINITIKGKTTAAAPLTEKSDQYKITKESASQLGLNFEAEE